MKIKNFNILMDHRENTPRLEKAKQYYKNQGDNVQIKELLIGDYIFNNQVVFEYKTLEDFIKSVKESRVFNQAIDQTKTFPYHFVIIVASEKELYDQFHDAEWPEFTWQQYKGAIARLNTYTTVIEASTEHQAIMFMRIQARKCLDNKRVVKRLPQKTDNPAFNYLMGVKHIGDDTAELIVDNLDVYDLEDLLNLDNNKLQDVKGIGSKTAGIVMRAIKRKRKKK
ncbi:MAG: hypothetical protein IJ258_05555 [Methanobrevibacter sp.]|uniref:ERCC4 domain-containing protein n=1 Tax=Methanobrevibacter sp. TaxID=66852 RepID=UPI0025CE1AA1|nr:ERCC4 domain-containing protein [Methanobrevibacter sp.]MBQ8017557.1 hypothetical protein [Methanobrevibacter sp.]